MWRKFYKMETVTEETQAYETSNFLQFHGIGHDGLPILFCFLPKLGTSQNHIDFDASFTSNPEAMRNRSEDSLHDSDDEGKELNSSLRFEPLKTATPSPTQHSTTQKTSNLIKFLSKKSTTASPATPAPAVGYVRKHKSLLSEIRKEAKERDIFMK